MPLPTKRERRLALRLRATELVGLLEGTDAADPETDAARERFAADLATIGRSAAMESDEARALGLDPLTFRSVALDSGARGEPPPGRAAAALVQLLAVQHLRALPAPVRVRLRLPDPDRSDRRRVHLRDHRPRGVRGVHPRAARARPPAASRRRPGTTSSACSPSAGPRPASATRPPRRRYGRRVQTLLDNFWDGELRGLGQAIHEELRFDLTLDPADGSPPVIVSGSIDRIDRLPSGGIEVIDYKTGRVSSQKGVDESLQLSIYALACRDALGLGTPERVTLYFTESATRLSTTRTDEQLDAARDDILARTARIRSGDFAATPSQDACRWCDFARDVPESRTS